MLQNNVRTNKKRRNSPCLATEKLNNNALVPFQVVSPVLPGCLHLYIFAMTSFLHLFHIISIHIHFIIVLKHCLYLHFVFPILFWLLAWPLHSDCESVEDWQKKSTDKLPICIPVKPLQQLWDKLMGVLLVPPSKFYLEPSHSWLEVGGCNWLVLGWPECLQNL